MTEESKAEEQRNRAVIPNVSGDTVEAEAVSDASSLKSRMHLTDRDRQLMGVLSWVRYLSEEQLCRLMYSGRNAKNLQRRLRTLAGFGPKGFQPPYVTRLHYQTYDGERIHVWALAERGHRVAESVVGHTLAPRSEVGADFLEHEVTLNELFVQMTVPHGRTHARAKLRGWRWNSSESARRAWTQYSVAAGKSRPRRLCADAIVELFEPRRRIFLECEMGGHPIRSSNEEKTGTVLRKAERYEEYFLGRPRGAGKDETFYSCQHPDKFAPELLFLVLSPQRQQSVTECLTQWKRTRPHPGLKMRALTIELAAKELRGCITSSPSRPRSIETYALAHDEAVLLRQFFSFTVGTFKELRARARAAGRVPPGYPPNADQVRSLLERIVAASASESLS